MFAQDRDIVTILKQENNHFSKLFDDHNSLHDKIEADSNHLSDVELETLKKQKLKLKDELYAMIHDHKTKK
ncbi:MAG: hypothetical protein ACI9TV_000349 [Sulfurimonas sp.]|jgi:uncharacterized protein YdcH (DUF465 family)|uniref:DUF465 domain-containing protein n=1 Tax=Sulfurimonas sp. TaxID=2022749 RepID=UPI0039E40D7A